MAWPESIRRAHIALAVLAVTILVASVVPVPSATPQTDPTGSVDTTTLFHIAGYAALAAGGVVAIARNPQAGQQHRHRRLLVSSITVVAVALFGVGTELLQGIIPWRTRAVAEMGLNAASAVGGGLLATMWFYRPVQ